MRNVYGTIIFFFLLLFHIAGIYLGNEIIEQYTKPLLMPVLIGYYLWRVRPLSPGFKKWIVYALLLSWAGVILLQFVHSNPDFFLAGLAAFLVAHIFYILFFHAVRVTEAVKPKAFLLIPIVIYYAGLIGILSPWLGNMKVPVRVYGVVICFMLMLALHMLYIKNQKAGRQMAWGAFLFVISDSVLAVNKFYYPFSEAGIIIMLTYGTAQFLIIKGAIAYHTSLSRR